MSHQIETVFFGPWVQGGEIEVVDLFPVNDHVMQLDGIGTSHEECVLGMEPGHESEGLHECAHCLIAFLDFVP